MLSRFRSHSEQKKVLQLLREGGVDIVIGTHRLISGDVVFKDLGLVVIDEEQRFGVLHKEKFKELFKLVDVLTLSATPIPRTLYLSLVGVKDMSTIETPPLNRLPVETVVSAYDERIIRAAIDRELERQGQVFFLHNRVASIERVRERIVHLCPQARVEIGHGQMDADELEAVMARFIAGKQTCSFARRSSKAVSIFRMQTRSSSIARINLASRICINCAGASVGPSTRRMPICFCRAK
jgi:transcription-repair coupling factor (superfamily II helicase)